MFKNCKQVVSKIEQSTKPLETLWTLEDADNQETFETLIKESKLQVEIGHGRTSSILEFSLGDRTETDQNYETEYLSLYSKLIKHGPDLSSSFYIQAYCSSSGDVDNLEARFHQNPLGKIFCFGDPTTRVTIVPDLFTLSSRPMKGGTYKSPPKKTSYEIPNRLSIGIVVTPLSSTNIPANIPPSQEAPDI